MCVARRFLDRPRVALERRSSPASDGGGLDLARAAATSMARALRVWAPMTTWTRASADGHDKTTANRITTSHLAFLLPSTIVVLACSSIANAQTIVPGGNTGTRTWSVAGSPYVVQGDVTVQAGATLTIEPGVEVLFEPGDRQMGGVDSARSELTVEGSLVASGTNDDPIAFRASSGAAPGTWYGIILYGDAILQNVSIEDVRVGLTRTSSGAGVVRVEGLDVQRCSSAGLAVVGPATFDRITVGFCGIGIRAEAGPTTLSNAVLHHNAGWGVYSGGFGVIPSGARLTIVNSTIADNGSGVYVGLDRVPVRLVNSIVASHTGPGLENTIPNLASRLTLSRTDAWGNGPDVNVSTSLSVNPQFASDGDYHLLSSSPCIDAGTDVEAPATDREETPRPLDGDGVSGAAWDLGAYEYRPTSCGDGLVDPPEVCDESALNGTYGHCDATCTGLGRHCGDALVDAPEECDDGNASSTDDCLDTCMTASCGDGFIHAGGEQCDDANTSPGDGCDERCALELLDGGPPLDAAQSLDASLFDSGALAPADAAWPRTDAMWPEAGTSASDASAAVDAGGSQLRTNGACGCRAVGSGGANRLAGLVSLGAILLWKRAGAARRRSTPR